MKLRIKANTVRLRLTRTEVEQFGKEGNVKESVPFGPGIDHHFHYEIIMQPDIKTLEASYQDHTIRVKVPEIIARRWVGTEQVGFEEQVNTGSGRVQLLIEKDFQCLHRDNAEEPDNYAHPLAK